MPNAQFLLTFNLQRMKPYTFLLILSSLGETRQATTIQKAFQRLLAPSLVPLGVDFGTCRHSPIGVTSVLQRQKIGPRTALGSGPVHMALQPSGLNFAVFLAVWPHVWVQLRILAVTSVNPRCQRRMEHIEECNLQNMILKVHFAVE